MKYPIIIFKENKNVKKNLNKNVIKLNNNSVNFAVADFKVEYVRPDPNR